MSEHSTCGSQCCCAHAAGDDCRIDNPLTSASCRFSLQGLGCASCAGKIEAAVQELPHVSEAYLNFTAGSLRVDSPQPCHQLLREVREIVERFEPGVAVRPWAEAKVEEPGSRIKNQIIRLSIGAALFILAFLVDSYISSTAAVVCFLASYAITGGSVLWAAQNNLRRGGWFDEHFLMSIATVGALFLGEYAEAVAVMIFYLLGEIVQGRAVDHSRREISALLNIRPDSANLLEGHQVRVVPPEEISIGQMILVRPGERVPLDGIIVEGESLLDSSALTGESRPRRLTVGDEVLAGLINNTSSLTLRVVKLSAESSLTRVIELVEQASEKKANTERFITRFARIYTPAVVLIAALIALLPPIFVGSWGDWFYRALIFLVVSCPCALLISIPLGFFGGIGRASKQGILVKGGNYLEALAQTESVVFDKTGTLTEGVFDLQKIFPANGFSADEVLELAALAEIDSNHPIAESIRSAHTKKLSRSRLKGLQEIAGFGISVQIDERSVLLGQRKLLEQEGIDVPEAEEIGSPVFLAVGGKYAGALIISDRLREGSAAAVAALRKMGVRKVRMLSGDRQQEAARIADELQLDGWKAELLPEQKLTALENYQQKCRHGRLVMVGDGINDAPVLARADIGVAMGGLGSDAAIEAADVVLMTDEPGKLAEAIETARLTRRIVWQNISLAFVAKCAVMLLGLFGLATIWQAIFADVGVALLAVLNAVRIIKV
ncbi:Cd2+/Zn2+-exporting ATPase [Malonomonas rubra DSM 5091]|uniref:P-type Zn(2+) transporter n=1 Tax=Malonomonas rubra DSM 5091 TaxID=1122189 RepID=A0A1M6I8N2_MALRU|nr:heavy metal translocating P-type ATPase [Malonomonas rubra]SHJ30782.1 Cd2+/Zn2+-exporting ATPase [Malonomonas rubra DSM 5091]